MISARNLGKRYGDVLAVDDVSLDIGKGEVVGLLGQNGAGKTTIMKMITGFLEPTSGTVTVDGLDVLQDRLRVQQRIGYLPENAPLYPELLVQDYLLWMASLRGIPEGERAGAVREAAAATGLQGHMLRPIGQLSKGFRQRVGIAQAILHKPPVLIFDEPTNGLDPVQIEAIRQLIRDLARTSTVLLSTHILQEVEAVCQRVMVLIDGRLVADDAIARMLTGHHVLLSVGTDATGVPEALRAVAGVSAVERRGPDEAMPGFEVWAAAWEGTVPPTPAIARAAVAAGWTIGALHPERFSLQSAFQRLQREEAARHAETIAHKGVRA
ncbi:MAG: ABC transporter ATP-binding protein [Pseudomonadota bacterium]